MRHSGQGLGLVQPSARLSDVRARPCNFDHNKLMFPGRVRAKLTAHSRAELYARFAADQVSRCPFANLPSSKTGHWGEGVTAEDMTKLRWVKPKVVIEVSFVEWTRDGVLRHSEFVSRSVYAPSRCNSESTIFASPNRTGKCSLPNARKLSGSRSRRARAALSY